MFKLISGQVMSLVSSMDVLIKITLILTTLYSVLDMVKKMERNIGLLETLGEHPGEKVVISDSLEKTLLHVELTLPHRTVLPVKVIILLSTSVDSVESCMMLPTHLVLRLFEKFYMF